MLTTTDYEIVKQPKYRRTLKFLSFNFKPYFKIKNDSEKTITLYSYSKDASTKKQLKIVLKPNEKIKVYYQKIFSLYWMNEETKLSKHIGGYRIFDKIVFDDYIEEEPEMKSVSTLIYKEKNRRRNGKLKTKSTLIY